MKSIEVKVPRNIVDKIYPHPELHGDFIVSLKNGMITDVFYDEDGCYKTITNEKNLIEYLNKQEHILPDYFYRNGVFSYRSIKEEDTKLLNEWKTIKTISISMKVEIKNCYRPNIDKLPNEFIFVFYWMEVGFVKANVTSEEVILTLDVYYDAFVRGVDKELALQSLRWMLEDENSLKQ